MGSILLLSTPFNFIAFKQLNSLKFFSFLFHSTPHYSTNPTILLRCDIGKEAMVYLKCYYIYCNIIGYVGLIFGRITFKRSFFKEINFRGIIFKELIYI